MNGHRAYYRQSGDFYRQCAADGLTQAQTARAWGVSKVAVSKWASANPDVRFAVTKPGRKPAIYHSIHSGGVV